MAWIRVLLVLLGVMVLMVPRAEGDDLNAPSGFEVYLGVGPALCADSAGCNQTKMAPLFQTSFGYRFNRWVGLYGDWDFGWLNTTSDGGWSQVSGGYKPYWWSSLSITPRAMLRGNGVEAIVGVGFTTRFVQSRLRQEYKSWTRIGFGPRFELGAAVDVAESFSLGVLGVYSLFLADVDGINWSGILGPAIPRTGRWGRVLDTFHVFIFLRFRSDIQ